MKLRALTLGLAVAGSAAMFVPASAASAATTTSMPAMSAPSSVDIVTPLPMGLDWRDHTIFRGNVRMDLPMGFEYKDGGIYDATGHVAVAPDGARGAVIEAPMACHGGALEFSPVDTSNWLSSIINGAFNAARAGVEAAAGIAQAAVGAASTPGAKC